MEEQGFSWHHAPGYVAVGYLGVKEMFKFLARIWPKQHQNGSAVPASLELRLGEVIKSEINPLRADIKSVDEKLDKHIQWHLEKGA